MIVPPSYRLPEQTHIGRVKLQVSDLGRSVDYYQDVIGLRVLHRSGHVATLGPHDDDTPLLELHERKGATMVPRRGLLGLYHFAILLPDQSALGRFLQHVADLGLRPGMSDHLVSEAIYLQDPDNLGIEVYRDRPRSEWTEENGQLTMATDPLDLRSVLLAGGDQPWTGAPAGTRIGHVHLHVGDIPQAESFYHAAIGFDKTVWSYPGALFLSAGGYHHHLGTNTWARGAPSATEDDARLIEWELIVPTSADVDAVGRSLEAGGHTVTRESREVVARDPWDTQLRVRAG
ncbi:MAG: VOC family protein [Gemmatimonadaceae bacterium]